MRASSIAPILVAATLLTPSPPARADFCADCRKKVFTQLVGPCGSCGAETNKLFKLCRACSARLERCEACGQPLAGAGQPGERPAGEVVGGVLVLTNADGGKTAGVEVGRTIVVRLHADKASGSSWKFDRSSSPAVVQVGKVRVIHDEVKKGLVGGTDTYEFRFRAVKAGVAVLTFLGGYPWEWKKDEPHPWKVTIEIADVKALAARRLKALQADVPEFVLRLRYIGPQDKPFHQVVLHVPPDGEPGSDFVRKAPLTEARARLLIDHLDRSGFLGRASDTPPRVSPGYVLEVSAGKVKLHEDLGWGPEMLGKLDALAKALEGEPARAMAVLLDRLSGLRNEWRKAEGERR